MCQSDSRCHLSSRPMSELTPLERGLLRAIRHWCRPAGDRHAVLAAVRGALAQEGLPDEPLVPLFAFLGTLTQNARPIPEVRCPDCVAVGQDEEALLAMFAACRDRRHGDAALTLRRWLPSTASGIAWGAAVDVVIGMGGDGWAGAPALSS